MIQFQIEKNYETVRTDQDHTAYKTLRHLQPQNQERKSHIQFRNLGRVETNTRSPVPNTGSEGLNQAGSSTFEVLEDPLNR